MPSPAQPGDPVRISAKEWNDVRAAAKIVLGGMAGGNVFQGPLITDEVLSVRIKNTSGEDRERFRVLAIDDMVFNLADNKEGTIAQPCLKLRTIEGTKDRGNVVVLQSPVKENIIHVGVFSGITAAYVNVLSDAHQYIDVGDEEESFVSTSSAAMGRIIWKPSGTGEKLCMVLIASASSGEAKIFRVPATGIPGASYDEEDESLTVSSAQCDEYVWNDDATKLIPLTQVDDEDEETAVTHLVVNPFYERLHGRVCHPEGEGIADDVDTCDDSQADVPVLDPPCERPDLEYVPVFFVAIKIDGQYVAQAPLWPTRRAHVPQAPQLVEDYAGRRLVFPVYSARIPMAFHDGCVPFNIAACGPEPPQLCEDEA